MSYFKRFTLLMVIILTTVFNVSIADTINTPVYTLTGHTGYSVESVAFSSDSSMFASTGKSRKIKLYSTETGKQIGSDFRYGSKPKFYSVAFSPDGKYIISGDSDGKAVLWDMQGNVLDTRNHGDHVYAVAFYPNGNKVIYGGDDTTVELSNITNKEIKYLQFKIEKV